MFAKLRIEIKDGNFLTAKVSDINTGAIIPVRNIRLDIGVDNWKNGVFAIIEVPIEEIELDDMLTKIDLIKEWKRLRDE